MATLDIVNYYKGLLILQYLQKAKASETIATSVLPILLPDSLIQQIQFTNAPASGSFTLQYNNISTASIAWNASAATIQTDLNAILISPLACVVTGSIASGLTITFSGNTSAVQILTLGTNSLLDSFSNSVLVYISAIGTQLPFDIQNGFNLTGSSPAVGVQLDILGKYVGVTRSGYGISPNGPITLDDSDFLTFIQLAIIRNNSGSSLATIQLLLNQFFATEISVYDYANMNMSYFVNTSIGSEQLLDLFISEKLLPHPMGVGTSVIAYSVIDKFFSFRSYAAPAAMNTTPFNSYTSYQTSWLFLSYAYAIAF